MTRIILGWIFLVLGVLGLFLPILQGVLFLAIGLAILAPEQEWAHRVQVWARHRFPHFAHVFDQARHKSVRWVHKVTHRRSRKS